MSDQSPPPKRPSFDPLYLSGEFFQQSEGSKDAAYKIAQIEALLARNKNFLPQVINRVADVGCGTGATTHLLQDMIQDMTGVLPLVHGYDIHPFVSSLPRRSNIEFFSGDFCVAAEGTYDSAALLDVIEHVPDPIRFIRSVSRKARLMVFHIPLDDSILSLIRHLPRANLSFFGHLLVLDVAAAINLLTFSGLRVLDFEYSPVFRAPSGRQTRRQKLLGPFRALLYRLSPYLAQKLVGGVSLTVLARGSAELLAVAEKEAR